MTLEALKAKLVDLENQFEQAKAAASRYDGAVQLLKHLIEVEEEVQLKTATPDPSEEFSTNQ